MKITKKAAQKCTALIISGGGAKGAFATGVIKQIFKEYRSSGWFSIIGGCSTGAPITPLAGLLGAPSEVAEEADGTIDRTVFNGYYGQHAR